MAKPPAYQFETDDEYESRLMAEGWYDRLGRKPPGRRIVQKTHFEVWRQTGFWRDTYRWRLRAKNGEIIAHGEGYKTRRACLEAVVLVKDTTSATPVEIIE